MLIAVLLSFRKILSIQTPQDIMNTLVRLIVLTSVIFILMKKGPEIFNKITQG
jgi:hypothetical protein